MGNYKANKNNVPKPSVAEKVIDFFKVCFESKEGVFFLVLLINLVVLLVVLVFSFVDGKPKAKVNKVVEDTTVIEKAPIVKDSIDMEIDKRAEQDFNSTIFAGLRFGSSKASVERVLKNKKYKNYSFTEIPIQVPVDDKVREVVIRGYDAVYYDEQLASLELYSNETGLYNAIAAMFTAKYGDTKNNNWTYSNCEIAVKRGNRVLYSSAANSMLASARNMYYDSFGGSSTNSLTADPYYLVLSYKDFRLLSLIERQKEIKDSLEHVKRRQEEEKEKELARKLATEVPTDI